MRSLVLGSALIFGAASGALAQAPAYTHADTLRGSYTTAGRAWWDVTFYDLHVAINPADSSLRGYNAITYRTLRPGRELQIDLMEPLVVDSMVQDGRRVQVRQDGRAWFAAIGNRQSAIRQSVPNHHRLLPRPPAGRQAAAMAGRLYLGRRQPAPRHGW